MGKKFILTSSITSIIIFLALFLWFNYLFTPKWKYDKDYRELLIITTIDYPLPSNPNYVKFFKYQICPDCLGIYNMYIKMNATQSYFNEFVNYHNLWSIKDVNNSDSSVLNNPKKFAYAASRQPKELLQMNNYEVEKSNNAIYDKLDWWDPDTSTISNNYGAYYDRFSNVRYNNEGNNAISNRLVTQFHKGYIYIFIDVGG